MKDNSSLGFRGGEYIGWGGRVQESIPKELYLNFQCKKISMSNFSYKWNFYDENDLYKV